MNVLLCLAVACTVPVSAWAQLTTTRLPRFEDFAVAQVYSGTPAPPKLNSRFARRYRTRIRKGVEKGWGVYIDGRAQNRPGPNFAGKMIVVQWSSGAPGTQMAMVDAESGDVYHPPITYFGVGSAFFDLPLLTVGNSVSRNPDVIFRLNSSLMIVRATPKQTQLHPSYTFYFQWQVNRWRLLTKVPIRDE